MADNLAREERRRNPRLALEAPLECAVKVQTRVNILDVSVTGMLLGSDVALPPGTRVYLRTFLGGVDFAADVQVQRTVARRPGAVESGVTFVRMDAQSQRRLEQFLARAK
jgi:hypothetical protein